MPHKAGPFIALLIIGIISGPLYFVYSKYYSGKEVERHSIFTQDASDTKIKAIRKTSQKNAQWNTPVGLNLSPDMNPITITAHIKYYNGRTRTHNNPSNKVTFSAKLSHNNSQIWEEEFSVFSKKKKNQNSALISVKMASHKTMQIKKFDLAQTGQYYIDIKKKERKTVNGYPPTIKSIEVQVRRNTKAANMIVVAIGSLFAFLSIITLGYIQNTKS